MRWWQKVLLTSLMLVLSFLATGYWYMQKTLAALPIQNLQFDIKSIGIAQLQFSHIGFDIDSANLQVQANDLTVQLDYGDWFQPSVHSIDVGNGSISIADWPATSQTESDRERTSTVSLPDTWQLPGSLPLHTALHNIAISLPCADLRCDYVLSTTLDIKQQQLQYRLVLSDAENPSLDRLRLDGNYQTVQGLPLLNSQLDIDNSLQLTIQQRLTQSDSLQHDGIISLNVAPPQPWLLQQLSRWQIPIPPDALAQFTSAVSVSSQWQLQLPKHLTAASFIETATGQWQLNAELPSPLIIPGVGQLQGNVDAALGLQQGVLTHYQIHSRLHLLQPQLPAALQQQGISADSVHLILTADGKQQPALTAMPLSIKMQTDGKTAMTISADATVNLTPPFSASLQNGNVHLTQSTLNTANDVTVKNIKADSTFNAYWLADSWQLDIKQSAINIGSLTLADTSVDKLALVITASQLRGDSEFKDIKLQTALNASLGNIQHAQLAPLSWQWHGSVDGDLNNLNIAGKLSNSASLGLTHNLKLQQNQISLDWQLDEIFLLAGNPLQATFSAWPALLEFNRGRISASGQLTQAPDMASDAIVSFSGVSGIYDRSLFKDVSANMQLNVQQQVLQLQTKDAQVGDIEHGIQAGPLTLSALYKAPISDLTSGTLDLQQLQLIAMGGLVKVDPMVLDLALPEQIIPLQLQQIDLSQILQQHPTTDLNGNGKISGTIPLLLGRNGATVQNGVISAESPGGELQYRPATAQSMAASNAGMKVVLDALDDFHYSVLSSSVSYDTSGKLNLGLTLKGLNPKLEAGRPINLNINLEEDIPAMITSLQLSSKISDKIKQRVQQRLQQQRANSANGVKQ